MRNIYKLIYSISTKQTSYFVKYITFFIIVAVLLQEDNSDILYSSLTYLIAIIFDIIPTNKQLSSNENNKLYNIETTIMVICIIAVIAIIILKFTGYTNVLYGRDVLNIVLILTTPHPLIEGLIKIQEDSGE